MLVYLMSKVVGPDTWGPVVWHALHYITLGYPEHPTNENKEKYKQFFTLLSSTIPCSICANHFAENLVKMPLDDKALENKESLVKWLIDIHNVVNEQNKKPIIKYEDARRMIEETKECKHNIIYEPRIILEDKKKEIKSNNNFFNIYYLIGLLLLIIAISYIMKKRV